MPLKPFPLGLNIGTDIVHLPRIHQLVTRREGKYLLPFARRILHPVEQAIFAEKFSLILQSLKTKHENLDSLIRWLGGRFAAKEAARKALGAHLLSWKEARIKTEAEGQPKIVYAIHGPERATEEEEARLSISHDGDYVVATVLATTKASAA